MPQKYIVVDATGHCVGFYAEEAGNVPGHAFPISEEQWKLWVANPHGFKLVGGEVVSSDGHPLYRAKERISNDAAAYYREKLTIENAKECQVAMIKINLQIKAAEDIDTLNRIDITAGYPE